MNDASQLKDLEKEFETMASAVFDKYVEQAANIAGITLRDEARTLSAIDTGDLRKSIESKMTRITSGVSMLVSPSEPYAHNIEFGQPPGTYVSPAALAGWVRRHGMAPGAAYAISRKIKKVGTKAHPFLFPALEKKEESIFLIIAQGVAHALNTIFNSK